MNSTSYRACAGGALAIGLAASAVATWLAVLGMQVLERDDAVRPALIAVGVLLTAAQLGAFGLAGLLQGLRGLRAVLLGLGVLLVGAEVAAVAVAQMAVVQRADAVADASASRMAELQQAIDARRATATAQRALAGTQQQAQAITAAARALRAAEAAEGEIAPMAAELAQLQAARAPTVSDIVGRGHVAWAAVIRAGLIAAIGVVFTWAAGVLARQAVGTATGAGALFAPESLRHATLPRPHPVAANTLRAPGAQTDPVIPQPTPETRRQWPLPQRGARDRS